MSGGTVCDESTTHTDVVDCLLADYCDLLLYEYECVCVVGSCPTPD